MAAIDVRDVTKQFQDRHVLDGLTLELHSGEVAAVVGDNGSGKTTLFRIIAGLLDADMGTVTRSKGLTVGYLPQEPEVRPDRTLHDEVGSAFQKLIELEHTMHDVGERLAGASDPDDRRALMARYDRLTAQFESAGGYTFETRLGEILSGLGFTPSDHSLPVSVLSGGQKCRAALAKLLVGRYDFLLLDEPTNHLDIEAVTFLERFIRGFRGGVALISHDRFLLDRIADRVVEIDAGRATVYPGNYSNYVQTRETRLLTLQRQYEKDRAFIEKESAFIAKHLAGQRTQEAKGRRKRLERRIREGEFVTQTPQQRRSMRLRFNTSEARSGEILRCDGITKGYDDKVLFRDLHLQVASGDRIGITGPNGTGKTTLLNILTGRIVADAGRIETDAQQRWGVYTQEAAELDGDRTVLEEIRVDDPLLSEQEARGLLGAFHFSGDDVFKPLGKLSGGEQSRVRLIKLILSSPDVLVLDEPTNHLDIASREALEQALEDFPGTIIAVSHDRYFLDRIVDRLLVIRCDGHDMFAGNYSDNADKLERGPDPDDQPERGKAAAKRPRRTRRPEPECETERKPQADPLARDRARYNRCDLEQIEELIMEQEQRLASLNQSFADPRVCRDPDRLESLKDEVETVQYELTVLESAWEDRMHDA